MIGDWTEHPLLRVLWQPRVLRAVQWAAEQLGSDMADGWLPVAVEARGERTLAGVARNGQADLIAARAGPPRHVDSNRGWDVRCVGQGGCSPCRCEGGSYIN